MYIIQEFKKMYSPKLTFILSGYALTSYIVVLIMVIFEDTSFFNSLSYTFTGFTICVFCVIFYLQSLANLKEENLIRSLRFWAVTAFFFYYSISFFNSFTTRYLQSLVWRISRYFGEFIIMFCFLLVFY